MKPIFRRFDPRLAAELRAQRRPITLGLICTAITSALYASVILLTKIATAAVEELARSGFQTGAMRTLGWACIVVIGVFGARYWFTRGQTYFLSMASNRLAADMRTRLFTKLMRLPVSYFNERQSGAVQSVLTNDVNVYQTAVGVIRDSIDGPIKAIAAFVTIVLIQPYLAGLAMLLIPVMVAVIHRNARKMRSAQSDVQEDLAALSAGTQEMLQGVRAIKAFAAEDEIEGRYRELVQRSYQSQMRAVARVASLKPLVELIGAFALAAVLYVGGYLAASGRLRVSDIAALALAMDIINQGFRSLGNVGNTYASVQAASNRIYEEVLDVNEPMQDDAAAATIEKPVGRIEFRGVSFVYPDGTQALDRVSFIIEPGTSLALVGKSGAGKSTIADLLLRFYDPCSGAILFDGVDVRTLRLSWLRSQIGVVPQQTFLFAGTIEDNVKLGSPDADDEAVAEALRLAHADEFARDMANRSDVSLGERGVKLSGGQMQRVAIARALIRKPAVLLLDEATSALDATSEKIVTDALTEVMQTRTTLFIAHRLTTAARANRILVLKQGSVVEEGTHAELLLLGGAYAGMYRAFTSGVMGEEID